MEEQNQEKYMEDFRKIRIQRIHDELEAIHSARDEIVNELVEDKHLIKIKTLRKFLWLYMDMNVAVPLSTFQGQEIVSRKGTKKNPSSPSPMILKRLAKKMQLPMSYQTAYSYAKAMSILDDIQDLITRTYKLAAYALDIKQLAS